MLFISFAFVVCVVLVLRHIVIVCWDWGFNNMVQLHTSWAKDYYIGESDKEEGNGMVLIVIKKDTLSGIF